MNEYDRYALEQLISELIKKGILRNMDVTKFMAQASIRRENVKKEEKSRGKIISQ